MSSRKKMMASRTRRSETTLLLPIAMASTSDTRTRLATRDATELYVPCYLPLRAHDFPAFVATPVVSICLNPYYIDLYLSAASPFIACSPSFA